MARNSLTGKILTQNDVVYLEHDTNQVPRSGTRNLGGHFSKNIKSALSMPGSQGGPPEISGEIYEKSIENTRQSRTTRNSKGHLSKNKKQTDDTA